jgi:hypothetical protein
VIVNAPRKSNSKNAPFFTGDGLLVGPAPNCYVHVGAVYPQYYSGDSRAASLNPAMNAAVLVYHSPSPNSSYVVGCLMRCSRSDVQNRTLRRRRSITCWAPTR